MVDTREILQHYANQIMNTNGKETIVDAMTAGMSIVDIVEQLLLVGAMEGEHTLDSIALVSPAMVELVAMIGDEYGMDYSFGVDEPEMGMRSSFLDSILADTDDEEEFEEPESMEDVPMVAEEQIAPAPNGLMGRR